MKKFTFATLIIFLIVSNLIAQNISISLDFKKPAIKTSADGYSEVIYDNCFQLGNEGDPLLPYYGADVLLPQGHEIIQVSVVTVTYSEEIYPFKLKPASRQFPISKGAPEGYQPIPNNQIYESNNQYPLSIVDNISTGYLAGHGIGSFSVCPVIYFPSENRVKFIESITVEIQTAPAKYSGIAEMLKSSPVISERINRIVENPGALNAYNYSEMKDEDDVDILLITKNSLVTNFNDYVSFKESTGYQTEVITTETIFAAYTGQDNQEKIRNCIKDYYLNHNLGFVILAGDADPNSSSDRIIPHRGLFAVDDDDIASDMYYACLDGSWNNDGDNKWGETGEYDLYAEVGIGRICIDNATEIANFTNKLKLYQNAPVVADIKKTLMVGEELNNNPPTYGDTYKEEIVDGTSINGFTTAGIPSGYQVSRLYDTQGGWDMYDVFQQFNATGVNLLNHLGHSFVTYNMRMETSNLTTTNFTNNGITHGFVIGYSQGCYNGSFDNRDDGGGYGTSDCFAEKFTTIATGEVASIANSRYGWYAPGATNSSSQYHDRQFFDAIFGEDITQIGFVNADAKEDNASFFAGDMYMRWVVYETNLFGDPSMDIWTDTPTDIAANYPSSIPIGSGNLIIQTNTPFARVGITQNGELIGKAFTDANGNATIDFYSPITTVENVTVSVIAHNKNRHLGAITVIDNQPFILFESYQINDLEGNNNGLADFGENIILGFTAKNVGNQPASNVTIDITSNCEYISITDNSEFFGNFSPEQSISVDNAFSFLISPNIPDNCLISFIVEAAGDNVWNSSFVINAKAPGLNSGSFTVLDPEGNNNGRIEPGENVTLVFLVTNQGQSDAPNTTVQLLTSSPFLSISNPELNFESLQVGQTVDGSFDVQVSSSAPSGILAQLSLVLTSGFYQVQKDFSTKIGMIAEDWESGDMNQYNWSTSGHAVYTVINTDPFEGSYCVKSGAISHNQYSILMLPYYSPVTDSISFHIKVSSEVNNDILSFYIDSQVIAQWSGELPWQRVSFPITPGTHSYKWKYTKNGNTSIGSDCAWVDLIGLPSPIITVLNAGFDGQVCAGSAFQCEGNVFGINTVQWSSSGTGVFSNNSIINPIYTPSQEDINSGSVILTVSGSGGSGTLTDQAELTIHGVPQVSLGPDLEVYTFETITLDAGNEGSLYFWSTGEITQTIDASCNGIPGVETFGVEVLDINGCAGNDEVIISFMPVTGIDNPQKNYQVNIFPNPNNGSFILQMNDFPEMNYKIKVYNSLGEIMLETSRHNSLKNLQNVIELETNQKGIYYLQITGENLNIVSKVILQ